MGNNSRTISVHIQRSCDGTNLGVWSINVFVDGENVLTMSRSDAEKLVKALEQSLEETNDGS